MSNYSPYSFKPPAPPVSVQPVPNYPSQQIDQNLYAQAYRVWKQHFSPPSTEQLLLECPGKILDCKKGILEAHVFISTNYISFLIDKRIPAVIPLVNIICWCKAVKMNTPGTAPYVKLKPVPNQPGKPVPEGVPSAFQLYTKDERLHLIFDLAVQYERICYVFDSTWRSHHPQLMQITANYQRRQQQQQQQQQKQQQLFNSMTGGFNSLGMNPMMNPMAMNPMAMTGGAFNPMMNPMAMNSMAMTGSFNPMMGQMAMNPMAMTAGAFNPMAMNQMGQLPPMGQISPLSSSSSSSVSPAAAAALSSSQQNHQQRSPSPQAPQISIHANCPPPVPPRASPSPSGGSQAPQISIPQMPPRSIPPAVPAVTVTAAAAPAAEELEEPAARPESAPLTLGALQGEDEAQGAAAGFNVVSASPAGAGSESGGGVPGREGSLLAGSTKTEWGNMPFEVLPGPELTFELGSRQAPVDEELRQAITLRNSSGSKHSFCFEPVASGKYTLSAEPSEGKIASGKETNVLIRMTVLCTTEFKLELPLIVWKGDLKDAEKSKRYHAVLTAEVESQLTTKLDSDELTLYSPPVGEGSFGTIYRGDYRGADVAVKVLKYQNALTPDMINDFNSEIGIMEKLRHPCIINFIGAVHIPGKFAIVTEFCPFGNLNGAIKKPAFGYAHKLKALLDTAKGMNFLHRSNIMHRDLKPDNILMVSMEVRSSVICKISDFGTTRDVNRFAHEMSFTKGVGTPIFMAPELLSGRRDYEKSADVYSFGMMMVNLITLKQPFEGDPNITSAFQFANYVIEGKRPSLAKVRVPDDYRALMEACWSSDPHKRPPFDEIVKKVDTMFKAAIATMK